MLKRLPILALLTLGALAPPLAGAQTNTLSVPLEGGRAGETVAARADAAVRAFARNAAILTAKSRAARARAGIATAVPFSLPTVVRLTKNGVPLRTVPSGRARSITLEFDPTFPQADRDALQRVFDDARSTIDAVFGEPAVGGTVRVVNYDANIGDRDAVAGAYYLPNDGTGRRVIRFPLYNDRVNVAGVNFIHTLLLAYLPDNAPTLDAFLEGPVRAATMRIVRQRSAVPTLDATAVENTLLGTYDVGARYDWNNQPALAGARFIAPNLRDTPLPAGGSLGGLYLLRYVMAGSAFEKVLAEHPTFLAAFNAIYAANPSIGSNRDALVAAGQQALNQVRPADPTVEGLSFADWASRQAILDTDTTAGVKLHVETSVLEPGTPASAGAFLFQVSLFQTLPNGNETLLGGTSYPISWTPAYDRIFPDETTDRVDIAGAYGNFAPSYPKSGAAATSYRAAVDVPVGDRIGRVYVPVGTVQPGGQSAANDLYGTLVGFPGVAGAPLNVRVTVGSEVFTAPATNNAFGINTLSDNFRGTRTVLVEVLQNGSAIFTRRVNKGPGGLELDLRLAGENTFTYAAGIPRGLSLLGFPLDPFFSSASRTFALPSTRALLARWNASRAKYELYPELDGLRIGQGVFVRADAAFPNFAVAGRTSAGTAIGVALKPGWNLVANPLGEPVSTNAISVVRAAESPLGYVSAVGTVVGADVFGFVPGTPDPASGAVETGGFAPDNRLEPGAGFFVRCLAPEGATLLFRPASARSLAAVPLASVPLASVSAPEFLASLTVAGPGESSRAEIASGSPATLRFDSPLPPGLGGLQTVVGAGKYREVGPLGADRSTTIDLTGLRPGRMYRVDLAVERGKAKGLTLKDPVLNRTFTVSQRATYAFRATAPIRRLTLDLKGASK